ncbi:hypothetical protein R3I82_004769, partial [Salmonella enterica]|nr:hypothetical protein [Salmonella enterica]
STTAATSCAGRERSRASASPAVTICTLPERWRGAPAVPDTRGHLRSSAPGHHHGGNLLRGAGTVTRQRVTCRHDLPPAGTLTRRSGCAGHQGPLRSSAPGYHYGNGVTNCDKNINLMILRMRKIESANPLKIALRKW